jgi:hypothetical protein
MRSLARSEPGTTQSEARYVDTVNTPFNDSSLPTADYTQGVPFLLTGQPPFVQKGGSLKQERQSNG